MRVLHVSHFHSSELAGGVQQVVDALVRDQRGRGWVPAVVSGALALDPAGRIDTLEADGTAVTRIHRRDPDERFSGDLGSARIRDAVAAAATAFAPDVCHVHHWHALTPDLVRTLAVHAPVVVTLHDSYTTCARFFRSRTPPALCAADLTPRDCAECLAPDLGLAVEDLAEKIAVRNAAFAADLQAASAVLAVSDDLRARLGAVPGTAQVRIDVAPLGVLELPGAVAPPAPLPGRLRLAHWAGIDSRKGLDLLADAVAGSDRAASFELHLFGRAPEPTTVDALRARCAPSRLVFHGPFSGIEGLRGIASTCDAAVAPSLLPETYGLAIDEALLMGMPIVVGNTGAPRERIGTRGVAVAVDGPGELRRVLEGWLRDPEELVRLRAGEHGARSMDQHASQVAECYRAHAGRR